MTVQETRSPATTPTTELAEMLAELRKVQRGGRTRAIEWRLAQLKGLQNFLVEQETAIVQALRDDLGRTDFEVWLGDIAGSDGEVKYAIKHLKKWMRPRRAMMPVAYQPATGWVQYEPLGVVLVIGPWNFPIYLSIAPMVAAFAAGNCVVLKPSELAPASSKLLAEKLPRYLDADAIRVVEGDGQTTQDLLALGFDHAFFTGGTEIGRKVMAGAAATLTPVTLELGGKSPSVVTKDADLGVAARRIVSMKNLNSGQVCITTDYVLVDESVKDEFVSELRTAFTEQLADRPGPLPIVNRRQFDRLAGYLDTTSGTVVMGGGTDPDKCAIDMTIVVDPDPDEPMMSEEIFGPLLPILGYTDFSEAIDFINDRPKPLAAYVFTDSDELADEFIDRVPAGGTVVNHIALQLVSPSLPFGGVGPSGMGAYHGKWGFDAMSHRKAVVKRRMRPDLMSAYAPFDERTRKIMRKIL